MDAATIQHNPNAVFNLAHYEAAETGTLTFKRQDGKGPLLFNGQPVTAEMFGPGSEVHVQAQVEFERAKTDRTMQIMQAGKFDEESAAVYLDAVNKRLAACTKSLNNFPIEGGVPALLKNQKLGYMRNQMLAFLDSWANFPSESMKD